MPLITRLCIYIYLNMQWLCRNSLAYRGTVFLLCLSYIKSSLTKLVVSRLNLISAVTLSFWCGLTEMTIRCGSMNCGPLSIWELSFFWLKDPIMTTDEVANNEVQTIYYTELGSKNLSRKKNLWKINMTKTDFMSSLISFKGVVYVYMWMCI